MDQDKFVPRDATTIKPHEVRVGDYFEHEGAPYMVIGIDSTFLAYVFTGLSKDNSEEWTYALMLTTMSGRSRKTQTIDIREDTLS